MDEWTDQTLKDLAKRLPGYLDQVTLSELRRVLKEQAERIDRAEGELDGRAWSKRNW
ncbi:MULTISPECIES: hypothetical protein [Lactobacillaceae]|uniref:Uncharacterized protein n=1 Tax=Limosilactobacillus alvi TaxID=990412 RepID=A0ABS2EN29_9LACO|nr:MULTISPECIES: hypothetical protein [Lactobacillaceae]MBM6753472.1 hypothetical protein [Limosilactobacillus alvi]QLL70913.1 hypothetical protein GTO83_10445 [Lactobacillus sp. 3B(2020)]